MASEKFKAMVHLIVASCDDPHRLGATRLNKICWYADTASYQAFGAAITTETYVKRAKGPVPQRILMAIRELENEKRILTRVNEHQVYKTKLFYSLSEPDKSLFSEREMEIISVMTEAICRNHTATSVSDLSHDDIWEAAVEGEELPFYATLVSEPAEITPEITAWADSVLDSLHANHPSSEHGMATC